MAEKKAKLTPFQEEMAKGYKKVIEYKTICEANVVSLLWKNQELIYANDRLCLEDFNINMWKVFWQISNDVVIKENKTLDEINVNFYLEKHPKLKSKYEEYGGFDKISKTYEYVKESDFEGYINELSKWNAVIRLLKRKFPIYDRINEFVDMNAEEIYDEYEALLNDTFIGVDETIKSYSLLDGLETLIDELDAGLNVGLPYDGLDILTRELGGQRLGEIVLIGGVSGAGKSTFARNSIIPSCIHEGERVSFILNEEHLKKVQSEMLVWVINNILKEDIQKYTVRDGNFNKETKDILLRAVKWLKEKIDDKTITIIPLSNYTTSKAIKIIKKYASLGCNYFVLDTFKTDSDVKNENIPTYMSQKMVDLFDTIKIQNKNVHLSVIFQLNKSSSKIRYLTMDNIGNFKSIIDPCSACIMLRPLYDDEREGESRALKVFRLEGKNGRTEIPVRLKQDKHYQILFIIKNRNGTAGDYQIVLEHDLSRNTIKEVGVCHVPMDW